MILTILAAAAVYFGVNFIYNTYRAKNAAVFCKDSEAASDNSDGNTENDTAVSKNENETKYSGLRRFIISPGPAEAAACTGAAGIIALGILGWNGYGIFVMILHTLLIMFMAVIAAVDLQTKIIPNKLLIPLAVIWAAAVGIWFLCDIESAKEYCISSGMGFLFSLLVFGLGYIFMKRNMGGGDVKLSLIMGLYLTGDIIFGAVMFSLLLCALFSLIGMAAKKLTLKAAVPLGPFLFIGTLAAMLVY
ncbi:MAG: prepilin peptidase [Huintestinicola sp.]